jgi:hypothetical protein
MNESINSIRGLNYKYILWAIIAILVFISAVLLWLAFGQDSLSELKPLLPTPTPQSNAPENEPVTVTFLELNENPLHYRNQSILVTGAFLPVPPPECLRYNGPRIHWSLTSENLQLDAVGYERIVRLLPVGSMMTVEGIWRFYQGPLGCGKGPPEGSAWFLEVKKVVQPNPLVGEGGQGIPLDIEDRDPGLPPLLPTEPKPAATATGFLTTATATAEGTLLASPTQQLIPTQTQSVPGAVTPTSTGTQTPTPGGPTATPSPDSTTQVETATATATNGPLDGTPTFTPESPQVPATSTGSPGDGYPGPGTPTATPSPSPNPYP